MTHFSTLLAPEALAAPDWVDRVRATFPESLIAVWGPEDEGIDEDEPRQILEQVCEEVLSQPEAIAHPGWNELLRDVVALSCDYRELTEDAYFEALDPDDAANDEGGVVEMIFDLGLSTIGDALKLLTYPAAVAREDWPELVRHVLDEKKTRFGTGCFLSCGWEEADQLFEADHVRSHRVAPDLWQYANAILPLEGESP